MPETPVVRLWITVHNDSGDKGGWAGSSGTLYIRDLPTWHLPSIGDEIDLWTYEPGDDAPRWPVRSRYWQGNGLCHLELSGIQVDPDERIQDWLRTSPPDRLSWLTDTDGDIEELLLANGWRRYTGDQP